MLEILTCSCLWKGECEVQGCVYKLSVLEARIDCTWRGVSEAVGTEQELAHLSSQSVMQKQTYVCTHLLCDCAVSPANMNIC